MSADSLYPPTPTNVPPGLTTPSASYRTRVVVVLASLVVFMAVYLALTLGSAYLCYWCLQELGRKPTGRVETYTVTDRRGRTSVRTRADDEPNPVLLIPGGLFSGLLCLFMVKGLFKGGSRNTSIK